MISVIIKLLATLAAGLFSGAAIYVNLVEHPARMQCGTALAVTEFAPSYKRATVMQASLAAFGSINGITAWLLSSGITWLIGGIFLGAVIPFTLIVMFPVNKKLLDPSLDKSSENAAELLSRWGRLHSMRSFLSLASFLIFIMSLVFVT
ncbi:conserved membrane hypothetical protein [Candidatus Sulfobium mesophilum]|uniref:DUF1772 domain-containing protein n=1 Tax=Candidatus Sulfobium mesophilum TaxID=2016548 RepID=A0A2U3QL30_9BACT|nr:conserved membrane hypothetical protein [Candidatus Sulfobium mesophilum]